MISDVYPYATKIISPLYMSKGKFVPRGVVVHYLGDRNVKRSIESLKAQGLGYHVILERDGSVLQTTYLSHAVSHAGNASWNKLSPNRHFLAVAVASWGFLDQKDGKLVAWNGSQVGSHEAQKRVGNISEIEQWWDIATKQQERELKKFLSWCVERGIEPKNICGHDECALPKGRKPDPGGVLSMSMADLRKELAK